MNKKKPVTKPKAKNNSEKSYALRALAVVLVSTLIAFYPAIHNEFTNWDDNGYVADNHLIRDLSSDNLKNFFTENVQGNYHPLTMISLALDYHFFGLNPMPYHITAIVFHLLNTALVFLLIYLLTSSWMMAMITAMLFGIAPLHVESVAWVSERKDVLYSFFFLASLICYVGYIKKNYSGIGLYVLMFLFMLCSLLSKGVAVTLPVIFLLIDFFMGRKFSTKVFIEKIPFFLLSFVFGYIAIVYQKEVGATQNISVFPFQYKILFASYGFFVYIIKLFVPLKLTAFYPYPSMNASGYFPGIYYLAPVGLLILAAIVFYSYRFTKIIVFGILFYLVTILLVLQLFPIGGAIIAERYSYIPSIGIFFLAGYGIDILLKNKPALRTAVFSVLAIYSIILISVTRSRCEVWHDSITLWDDVISKNPKDAVAHTNRALVFKQRGDYTEAIQGYKNAIAADSTYADAYLNLGNVYFAQGKNELALINMNRSIRLKSNKAEAYSSRGALLASEKKYEEALRDFEKAIQLDPLLMDAYKNRGNLYGELNKPDSAIMDYDVYLKSETTDGDIYYWRAVEERQLKKMQEAIADFSLCIQYRPDIKDAYYERSRVYYELKNYSAALADAHQAISLGVQVEENYLNKLKGLIQK